MKVLILTAIFPPDIGGPATYVPAIAEALAERGHQVTVVTSTPRGPVPAAPSPGYRLVRFRRVRVLRYANFVLEFFASLRLILREARRSDVVFVNGLELQAGLAGLLLKKPMVVKMVGDQAWEVAYLYGWTRLSFHQFQNAGGNLLIRGLKRMQRFPMLRAATVITPSRYLAGIAEGWGVSRERIRVIYNAIPDDPDRSAPAPGVLPEKIRDRFKLVTAGRLVPYKQIEGLLRLLLQFPDAALIVVGDGPCRADLEDLSRRLRVEERAFFAGRRPNKEVRDILTQGDVFVLNSIYEGYSHILIEAMQCGVPIVATAIGGTPELVLHDETGILVPTDDEEGLVLAIRRLQQEPEMRRRLASNAWRFIQEVSFERMVDETERVLAEAAYGRPSSRV